MPPSALRNRPASFALLGALVSAVVVGGLAGCQSSRAGQRAAAAIDQFEMGQLGVARQALGRDLPSDRRDRNYLLSRLRLLMATLADGRPAEAELVASELFDLLRTQGLNDDNTTAAVVFHEGVRIWKGEPFEQAMAFSAIAVQRAALGDWGNARAAASNSLFLLKDFGDNERGRRKDALDLARLEASDNGALDSGYQPIRTNFTLGYMLVGISALAMDRTDEARDNFNRALELQPQLLPVVDRLLSGRTALVLVVDAGRGPAKISYGPDGALARFVARAPAPAQTIALRTGAGSQPTLFTPVLNLADIAADHTWNNLEDVRIAKSRLGEALLLGGIIVATQAEDDQAQLVGLGVAILGGILRASASADTRYCELLPNQTFIVPLLEDELPSEPGTPLVVQLQGARAEIAGIELALAERAIVRAPFVLRSIRMPDRPALDLRAQPRFRSDVIAGEVPGQDLPYILGGRCVRVPSPQVLREYQASGHLLDMSLADLENLYREEGIVFRAGDIAGQHIAHVLEGGRSLVPPQPGTLAATRLFCTDHPPYRPTSSLVRDLARAINDQPRY